MLVLNVLTGCAQSLMEHFLMGTFLMVGVLGG